MNADASPPARPTLNRLLRAAAALAVLVGVLAWLLYAVAPLRRAVVAPLATILEAALRLYQAVPPAVLWLLVILLAYLLASASWIGAAGDWLTNRRRPESTAEEATTGRVAYLARWLGRRRRGSYSRHYVKRIVSELAVEHLAQARRLTMPEVKLALETNVLGLPPDVNAYLLAGLSAWPLEPSGGLGAWLRSRLGGEPTEPPDTETEAVVRFLEDELNAPRG